MLHVKNLTLLSTLNISTHPFKKKVTECSMVGRESAMAMHHSPYLYVLYSEYVVAKDVGIWLKYLESSR